MNEKTKRMLLELGETLLDTAVTFLAAHFLRNLGNGSKKQKRVLADEGRIDEQAPRNTRKIKEVKSRGNRTRKD